MVQPGRKNGRQVPASDTGHIAYGFATCNGTKDCPHYSVNDKGNERISLTKDEADIICNKLKERVGGASEEVFFWGTVYTRKRTAPKEVV